MRLLYAILMIFVFLSTGCTGGRDPDVDYPVRNGGDPVAGARVIANKDCGSCHTIPGIRQAHGLVGPPLMFFGRRTMIAGQLPNTPDNLQRWIRAPQSVEADTAMPNLGLSDDQARDVAAYLHTLR